MKTSLKTVQEINIASFELMLVMTLGVFALLSIGVVITFALMCSSGGLFSCISRAVFG
jgi:hypothetical protein